MSRRGGRILASLVLLALVGTGCGDDKNDKATGASFAAPVAGTDAFVGVVVNPGDRQVMAYVCDGRAVATWLRGEADTDGAVELTSRDGARLAGRIAGDVLSGTVTLGAAGGEHAFRAPAVKPPAGLYRARGEAGGEPAVGGWVVLADGQQRGAVRTSSGFIDRESDFARPGEPVTSFITTDTDF